MKNVMFKTKMLSNFLQGETVDAAGALVAMSSTDGVLKRMRAEDNEINDEIKPPLSSLETLAQSHWLTFPDCTDSEDRHAV